MLGIEARRRYAGQFALTRLHLDTAGIVRTENRVSRDAGWLRPAIDGRYSRRVDASAILKQLTRNVRTQEHRRLVSILIDALGWQRSRTARRSRALSPASRIAGRPGLDEPRRVSRHRGGQST